MQTEFQGTLAHPYMSKVYYTKPLASISRTTDGRFILDKDSEEGGFTSSRRPIQCLLKRPSHFLPYSPPEADSHTYIWMDPRQDHSLDRDMWRPETEIESGVYHVRTGRASRLEDPYSAPPRLSLRSDGSGASAQNRDRVTSIRDYQRAPTYYSPISPEFGRHFIPDSPGERFRSPLSRRFRSSSPGPFSNEWSQLAQLASFSEVSSVKQPSSAERSFPSTVLSSLHHSAQRTPSVHELSIAHAYQKELVHQQRLRQQAISQNELPILTPIRTGHGHRYHVVGAQVHSPPIRHPLIHPSQPSGMLYYLDHLRHWEAPSRRPVVKEYKPLQLPYGGFVNSFPYRFRGPLPYMFTPPYREILVSRPLVSPDTSHHYVNLSPRRDFYQRIPGQEPYYLLKPPPSENQKPLAPLATSSPPRSRPRPRRIQQEYDLAVTAPLKITQTKLNARIPSAPSTKVPEIKRLSKDNLQKEPNLRVAAPSESSSDKPVTYTRDRLQEAIGRVRSGFLANDGRPHSAPILSSTTQDEVLSKSHTSFDTSKTLHRKPRTSVPLSQEASYEQSQEISHEQSPDSSSGFGSKNTSHQQSSSQSGHSASALGLDSTSRFETSEQDTQWDNIPSQPYASSWAPPRNPPSYDEWLSRRHMPQHGVTEAQVSPQTDGRSSNLLMRISEQPPTPQLIKQDQSFDSRVSSSQHEQQNEEKSSVNVPRLCHPDRTSESPYLRTIPRDETVDITEPLSINTTHRTPGPPLLTTAPLNQVPNLDISVDDHYEFDTVLSPTPGDDTAAVWSRARIPSGEKGLSDSEIYGTGGRRKKTQESTEDRVAAMKQEFHEYRQRQARRRRSRELESVC